MKKRATIKRLLLLISILALIFVTACNSVPTNVQQPEQPAEETTKKTSFDTDVDYLLEKGITIPDLAAEASLSQETLFSLMATIFEAIGQNIDISLINPSYKASDSVKKMTLLGVYDNTFIEDDALEEVGIDYGATSYFLLKFYDAVQERLYARDDQTATVGDLLLRINTMTALHSSMKMPNAYKTYKVEDLLEEETLETPLTKLIAAKMLVNAYEDASGAEIEEKANLSDTDDLYARKATNTFYWLESDKFEPNQTGVWSDWSFMAAIIYESQLRLALDVEESEATYGSVIAALTTLIRHTKNFEQSKLEEKIVLNERPYDWYVTQQETGQYSLVNCMPATISMAMKYQGLDHVPSVEQLRNDNKFFGRGWTDVIAENVMREYGLNFTDSFDASVDVEKMLAYLDEGHVLYVMYREESSDEGHSVIIKGYWKLGDQIEFIISDPNQFYVGPFGYIEYTRDANTVAQDMERHLPRYFIIPSGQ